MNHAYFYRPKVTPDALDGFTHIILQSFDEKFRDLLIAKGVEVQRYGLPQPEGPPELVRGDVTITTAQITKWNDGRWGYGGTWRNGSTFTLGEFVKKYHVHETYFLHDANGNRLYTDNQGRRFYLLRPRFAAKQWWTDVKAIMDRDGWSGAAFVDNVGLDASKIEEVLDVPAMEYAGGDQDALYQAEWAEFLDVGRLILGKRPIWINGIGDWKAERDIDPIVQRIDGIMLEAFAPWLNMRSGWMVDDDVRMLQRVQKLTGAGKQVVCVAHVTKGYTSKSGKAVSADPPERLSYEYARYLMVHDPALTSFRLVFGTDQGSDYGPITKVPEMDLELGKPLGPAKMSAGLKATSREFEHYTVIVDLANKKPTFQKIESLPEPPTDPRDAQIATLQEQVQGVLEREQQYQQIIEGLQQTVSDLQTRLNGPIQVTGTVKI
jgi:hypothetical protein